MVDPLTVDFGVIGRARVFATFESLCFVFAVVVLEGNYVGSKNGPTEAVGTYLSVVADLAIWRRPGANVRAVRTREGVRFSHERFLSVVGPSDVLDSDRSDPLVGRENASFRSVESSDVQVFFRVRIEVDVVIDENIDTQAVLSDWSLVCCLTSRLRCHKHFELEDEKQWSETYDC